MFLIVKDLPISIPIIGECRMKAEYTDEFVRKLNLIGFLWDGVTSKL